MYVYSYDPITTLTLNVVLIVGAFLTWNYILRIVFIAYKYRELYELHKLEELLKERKIDFSFLDAFEKRILKRTSFAKDIQKIDKEYELENKKTKQ